MFRYLRVIITALPAIIWAYFVWIIRYSRHPERYPLEKRYKRMRDLTLYVFKCYHIDLHIENSEILKKQEGRYVIMPNHLSDVDPLLMIAVNEKPITFVAKKEILKMPIVGRALKTIDGLFLDRDDLRQQVKIIQKAEEFITSDYINMCIFPEGTRNKKPLNPPNEFKPGSLKIAYKAGVNIIPVAIYGSYRPFEIKYHYKRFPVTVHFFDPIPKSEYEKIPTPELAITMHDKIALKVEEIQKADPLLTLKKID